MARYSKIPNWFHSSNSALTANFAEHNIIRLYVHDDSKTDLAVEHRQKIIIRYWVAE